MERLTEYLGTFAGWKTPVAKHGKRIPKAPCGYDCIGTETGTCEGCWYGEIITRLSAYEDTGLEPEEIRELCTDDVAKIAKLFRHMIEDGSIDHLQALLEAEKAGRLLVLPCKLTDTVYIVESVMKGKRHIGEKIVSAQIDHVTIGESGKPVLDVCTETGNWYGPLEAGEFWTTREEAEEELRKEADNG